MKYFATFLILLALGWTWHISQREESFGLAQHKAVENEVETLIESYIRDQRPNASSVIFEQLFTETVKPNEELRARFRYQVTEPSDNGDQSSETVEGSVNLASNDGGKTWNWTGQNVKSPAIEFKNGSKILATPKGQKGP